MVVSDNVGVSESLSLSFEAGFLLPLCGGRLPVLGRCGHKEGRSDRQGSLRHELDSSSDLQRQCEWDGVDSQSLVPLYVSNLVSVFLQNPHIDPYLPLRAVVYARIQYRNILPQYWLHSQSIGSHTHHTGQDSSLP
jgi:hypothetical protein